MDKIYEHANDLHVVATMVYSNGDGYAYVDAEYTKKFTKAELKNAFIKGAAVVKDDLIYKPISFAAVSVDGVGDVGEISYITYATESTTVTHIVLRSEPDAEVTE